MIGFCATISSVIAPSLDCSYFGRLKSNQGVLGDFLVEVYHLNTFYESKTEEEEISVFVLIMLMALTMMTV